VLVCVSQFQPAAAPSTVCCHRDANISSYISKRAIIVPSEFFAILVMLKPPMRVRIWKLK